jgi:hypothetical protein
MFWLVVKRGLVHRCAMNVFPLLISRFPRVSLGVIVIIIEPLVSINEEGINR